MAAEHEIRLPKLEETNGHSDNRSRLKMGWSDQFTAFRNCSGFIGSLDLLRPVIFILGRELGAYGSGEMDHRHRLFCLNSDRTRLLYVGCQSDHK